MKKVNIKKRIAATAMCVICALPCSSVTMNVNAASTTTKTSSTGSILDDVVKTAESVFNKATAIVINKNYNMKNTNKAADISPHYINSGMRSASNYNMIIDQFNVEKNPRYKRTASATYCNIFVADVIGKGMNVPFSHWIGSNGSPLTYSVAKKTKGAYECNVKSHLNWMKTYGSKYGWRKVSASEAQKRANMGYPTIVMNNSGTHIAVVRPETSKFKYTKNNPVIAQAGAYNVNYGKVGTYFGTTSNLSYWTHD